MSTGADLRELTYVAVIVRVLLSILIGGAIGLERERKNQPAGSRTYMLVCLGACLVMMTNQYIYIVFQGGDPSRLGAQVVSGIGFLGAGTILVTGSNQIRGLTTAAGLWASACIGLALGIGFYEGAIAAGVILMLIISVLKHFDDKIQIRSPFIRLYVNFASVMAMNDFMECCNERRIHIMDMQISKAANDAQDGIVVLFTLKNAARCDHQELVKKLKEGDGVRQVEELLR